MWTYSPDAFFKEKTILRTSWLMNSWVKSMFVYTFIMCSAVFTLKISKPPPPTVLRRANYLLIPSISISTIFLSCGIICSILRHLTLSFFVNSPNLVAYPAAITIFFTFYPFTFLPFYLYTNLAPSSGFTQNTWNVFSYSGNCSKYLSVSTLSIFSLKAGSTRAMHAPLKPAPEKRPP